MNENAGSIVLFERKEYLNGRNRYAVTLPYILPGQVNIFVKIGIYPTPEAAVEACDSLKPGLPEYIVSELNQGRSVRIDLMTALAPL